MTNINLRRILSPDSRENSTLRDIYFVSFPPEERRPWDSMFVSETDSPEFYAIEISKDDSAPAICGLITIWNLDGVRYIEHFAVSPDFRSAGIGHKVLALLEGPVILEVEPPETSPEAVRRIGFYSRNGFELSPVDYVQPPYTPDLPAIPLKIMTKGKIKDINATIRLLHSRVYKFEG